MSRASAIMLTGYVCLHLFTIFTTEGCLREHISPKKYRVVRILWMIPYIIVSLIPIAGAYATELSFTYYLQRTANVILGFDIFYSGFLLLFAFVNLIVRAARRKKPLFTGSMALWAWLLSLILGLSLPVYGLIHAQHPGVTYWKADLADSEGPSKEIRVALIADLHLGVNSNPELISKITELVNAQEPDIILIAGDIFNSTYYGIKDPEEYIRILSQLHADQGVYAVYGNHDVDEDLFGGFAITELQDAYRIPEMDSFVEKCGFTMLKDETVSLDNGNITLVGRIDGERAGDGTDNRMSASELLSGTGGQGCVWVLEHEPWDFSGLSEAGADIVFCGHTHRGQIFPVNFFVGLFNDNAYGYREVDGLDTFVTSGVGYYGPPMRIATDSEVMIIDVKYPG